MIIAKNHTNLHNNHENPDQNPNTEPSLFQSWGRSCEWTAWTRNLAYLVVEVWSDHHYCHYLCQPTPPSCWSPGNTTEWLYKWDRSTPNGPTIGFFLRPGDLSERWVFVFLLFHNVGIDSSKFGLHSLKRSLFVSFWAPPSSGDATHNLQWMAPNHPRAEGSWNIWAEPFTQGFLPGETGI